METGHRGSQRAIKNKVNSMTFDIVSKHILFREIRTDRRGGKTVLPKAKSIFYHSLNCSLEVSHLNEHKFSEDAKKEGTAVN